MPEVFLDGEDVDFQGPAPSSANAVYELIENHLGSAERLIESFEVDGKPWTGSEKEVAYSRIDIRSESQVERLLTLTETTLGDWESLEKAWNEIGSLSLSVGDEGLRKLGGQGLDVSGSSMQLGQFLAAYGENHGAEWVGTLKAMLDVANSGLSHWMDAFEEKNVIGISEYAVNEVRDAFDSLRSVYAQAREDLENRKAKL